MDLKTQLKNALKAAGLSEDLADSIQIKDESEIEARVQEAKEASGRAQKLASLQPDELKEVLKNAGLDAAFDKLLQSETDRRVTQALKTHDEKLQQKAREDEEKKKKEQDQQTMTPEQKEISSLKEMVVGLTETIKTLSNKVSGDDRNRTIAQRLEAKKIPAKYARYVTATDEDKIAEQIAAIEEDFIQEKQRKIDESLENGDPPTNGNKATTITEAKAAEYADRRNKGQESNAIVGRDLTQGLVGAEKK